MTTPFYKITKVRLYLLFLLSILGVVLFVPKTYATSYFQPVISIGYSVSRTQCNSSTCWTVYGSEYTATAVLDSYDQQTGEGSYHFDVNSNVPTWCSGYQCYINIRYFMVNTRYLSNGSYVTPDFSDGSMLHIKIISGHQFYFGDGTDINFNFTGQGNFFSVTGGDVMLNSWTSNNPYLCWGEGQGICETHYYEDLTQTGGLFTSTLDLDTSKINTNVTAFYFGEWPFNINQDAFVITTSNSFVHQFEWKGASSTDLTFKAVVSTDSTFSSTGAGEDIEDAIYRENEIINQHMNDAQSAAGLLSFSGFNVPWIFSAWFSLFINNDCVNIPTLAGMLNTNNTQVCSPWAGTNIRTILTPIFGALSSMLAFAFVIRWLSNSNDIGKDDLGDIWYGK